MQARSTNPMEQRAQSGERDVSAHVDIPKIGNPGVLAKLSELVDDVLQPANCGKQRFPPNYASDIASTSLQPHALVSG